jgi:hypothetical protein
MTHRERMKMEKAKAERRDRWYAKMADERLKKGCWEMSYSTQDPASQVKLTVHGPVRRGQIHGGSTSMTLTPESARFLIAALADFATRSRARGDW